MFRIRGFFDKISLSGVFGLLSKRGLFKLRRLGLIEPSTKLNKITPPPVSTRICLFIILLKQLLFKPSRPVGTSFIWDNVFTAYNHILWAIIIILSFTWRPVCFSSPWVWFLCRSSGWIVSQYALELDDNALVSLSQVFKLPLNILPNDHRPRPTNFHQELHRKNSKWN